MLILLQCQTTKEYASLRKCQQCICLSVCLSVHPSVCPSVCPSVFLSVILTSPLPSNFVYTISEDPVSRSYTERSRIFERTGPKLAQSRVIIYSNFEYLNRPALNPGGRCGVLYFFSYVGSGPASTFTQKINFQEFQAPQKIFEILAAPKIPPNLYLDLKKRP